MGTPDADETARALGREMLTRPTEGDMVTLTPREGEALWGLCERLREALGASRQQARKLLAQVDRFDGYLTRCEESRERVIAERDRLRGADEVIASWQQVANDARAERDVAVDALRAVRRWERSTVGEVNDFTSLRRIVETALVALEATNG